MDNNLGKFVIVGVGNCGSQVARLAVKKNPTIFKGVYVNTSDADLSMVTDEDGLKIRIGKTEDAEGSGKNRALMKSYLQKDIKAVLFDNSSLREMLLDAKYCFVVASTAGGTGSGAAPILMEILQQMFLDTNFILISVLPQINASLMEQGNTLEFLQELYNSMSKNLTYMVYDNETASDLPPTQALEAVNESIVDDLRILTGIDNHPTPYESIDEADMESILTTPGRLLVTRITKGLSAKVFEDNAIDEMLIKAIKSSNHAETDRNKRVVRWGIITYFTDTANQLYSANLTKLEDFIGTPIERFNHNAINPGHDNLNFMYLIASGLSPINDRVQKITDRIDELQQALATDETSKYVLGSGNASYESVMDRRKKDIAAKEKQEIDIAGIFGKFSH